MKVGTYCKRQFVVGEAADSLFEAASRMRRENSEYLVVVEKQGNYVTTRGVLTSRDIVNQSILEDIDPKTMTLADIIISEPVIAREDDDVDNIITRMSQIGIHYLPVVNNEGLLTGIFTIDDLIHLLSDELKTLKSLAGRELPGGQALRTVLFHR